MRYLIVFAVCIVLGGCGNHFRKNMAHFSLDDRFAPSASCRVIEIRSAEQSLQFNKQLADRGYTAIAESNWTTTGGFKTDDVMEAGQEIGAALAAVSRIPHGTTTKTVAVPVIKSGQTTVIQGSGYQYGKRGMNYGNASATVQSLPTTETHYKTVQVPLYLIKSLYYRQASNINWTAPAAPLPTGPQNPPIKE